MIQGSSSDVHFYGILTAIMVLSFGEWFDGLGDDVSFLRLDS
jgi:hypothetical protein